MDNLYYISGIIFIIVSFFYQFSIKNWFNKLHRIIKYMFFIINFILSLLFIVYVNKFFLEPTILDQGFALCIFIIGMFSLMKMIEND